MNIGILLILLLLSSNLWAEPYEGFTEPEQEIELAAPEMGILEKIMVKEGERVHVGQLLANLQSRDLGNMLEIARLRAKSTARLRAAQAELKLHRMQLEKLEPLQQKGLAHPQEVNQSRMEVDVAAANVQAANEELAIAKLDSKRIAAQIENRTLRSPIDGVVTEILRDVAELVGANQSHVMTIAALDKLKIRLHLPTVRALHLKVGDPVKVVFNDFPVPQAEASVAFISPVTDAGSDTVTTHIALDNQQGKLRAGIRCQVHITHEP